MGNILGAFGEVQAVYNTIVIVGISLIFFIVGISILNMPTRDKIATGKVFKILRNGTAKINYSVDGQTYILTQNAITSSINGQKYNIGSSYTIGDTVDVLYAPSDPANGRLESTMSTKWVGWIFVILSSVFITGTIFNLVMVMRHKSVAEVEGGIGIAQDVFDNI